MAWRLHRGPYLAGVVCACVASAACGQGESAREAAGPAPVPAPRVTLSAADRKLWAPRPPSRAAVPALVYRDMAPADFARQMVLLDHAGYEAITLDEFVRFVKRRAVSL